MSQSLARNHIHVIFGTKYREHILHEPIRSRLHAYLAKVCLNLECYPKEVGGYTDHVHIACRLSKKISLVNFIEEVKTASSKWLKNFDTLNGFHWQGGYAAFSVSESGLDRLQAYIRNQVDHHKVETFEGEYRRLLIENNMDFDERYFLD